MSRFGAARDHYLGRHAAFLEALGPEPGWLATLRREALATFATTGQASPRRPQVCVYASALPAQPTPLRARTCPLAPIFLARR